MHRLVVSFWDCFMVTLGGLMLLYYMEGRRGGLVAPPPPREILVEYVKNFDILDQLNWTKNSAYRTVPFLDFWVLE